VEGRDERTAVSGSDENGDLIHAGVAEVHRRRRGDESSLRGIDLLLFLKYSGFSAAVPLGGGAGTSRNVFEEWSEECFETWSEVEPSESSG
jgi:hypothetical protein